MSVEKRYLFSDFIWNYVKINVMQSNVARYHALQCDVLFCSRNRCSLPYNYIVALLNSSLLLSLLPLTPTFHSSSLYVSLSLSLSHTHTYTHTHTHTRTHKQTNNLTNTHTHTHTLEHPNFSFSIPSGITGRET